MLVEFFGGSDFNETIPISRILKFSRIAISGIRLFLLVLFSYLTLSQISRNTLGLELILEIVEFTQFVETWMSVSCGVDTMGVPNILFRDLGDYIIRIL